MKSFQRFALAWLLLFASLLWGDSARAANYQLAAGDVVAVIVHGVVGEHGRSSVHFPKDKKEFLPAMGHPFLVLEDGKLHLPLIEPVSVHGMTVVETQRLVEQEYLSSEVIKTRGSVMVTLMRKRTVDVLVVHDTFGETMRSSASVRLSAEVASPLASIVSSGSFDPDAKVRVLKPAIKSSEIKSSEIGSSDIGLPTGSLIVLQSTDSGRYFTGGQLRPGQHTLPSDRSLSLLEAISAAGGVQTRSFLPPHRVLIVRPNETAFSIPWAHMLANPTVMIRSGDTIIVE